MNNTNAKTIHSLVSLISFKTLYGIDDREDDLACFLLEAATSQIERYCMRRLVFKRITQGFELAAGNCFQLLDYPVRTITKVELREKKEKSEYFCLGASDLGDGCVVSPDEYHLSPMFSDLENYPCFLHLHSSCRQYRDMKIVKVVYFAGYRMNEVPPDLKKACLELAAWSYKRLKENVLGEGMPQGVCELLMSWKRGTI
jgi:hypothetical protein